MDKLTIKDITKELQIIAGKGYSLQEVFRDFMEVSAIAVYNSFAKDSDMEKQYMSKVVKYDKDIMVIFSKCFALLTELMEQEYQDYLGQLASEISILSRDKGQVFTPLHIAEFMAKSTLTQNDNLFKKENHLVKILEPSAGTGVFLVAIARTCLNDLDINFQEKVYMVAWELDSSVFYGLYLQASLMGYSATIINGNTLLEEIYKEWVTPLAYMKRHKLNYKFSKMKNFDIVKEKLRKKRETKAKFKKLKRKYIKNKIKKGN